LSKTNETEIFPKAKRYLRDWLSGRGDDIPPEMIRFLRWKLRLIIPEADETADLIHDFWIRADSWLKSNPAFRDLSDEDLWKKFDNFYHRYLRKERAKKEETPSPLESDSGGSSVWESSPTLTARENEAFEAERTTFTENYSPLDSFLDRTSETAFASLLALLERVRTNEDSPEEALLTFLYLMDGKKVLFPSIQDLDDASLQAALLRLDDSGLNQKDLGILFRSDKSRTARLKTKERSRLFSREKRDREVDEGLRKARESKRRHAEELDRRLSRLLVRKVLSHSRRDSKTPEGIYKSEDEK
jgi:hypothetical protein